MKNLEKILAPFNLSLGRKQDLGTLLTHLKSSNVSMDEVIEYIDELKLKGRRELAKRRAGLKCPECETVMSLFPVNTSKRDRVEDNLRSMWLCPKCWYDEFSEKTTKDWLIEINKNPFV